VLHVAQVNVLGGESAVIYGLLLPLLYEALHSTHNPRSTVLCCMLLLANVLNSPILFNNALSAYRCWSNASSSL
jgi:hypothetical protein